MKRIYFTTTAIFCFLNFSLFAQVVQNGLVGHFRMDANADDVSPLNMDGIASGTTPTAGKNGAPNTALLFVPASTSGIDAGVNNRNITNQITMSAWIKTTSTATSQIINKYDWMSDGGYYLEVYQNKAIIAGRDGGGSFIYPGLGTTTVNDGQWHFVLGIVDGNSWQIWVDCNMENSTTTTTPGPNITCTYPLVIGYSYYGTLSSDPRYFDGSIDEVRIYNRVLSSQEIDSICMITEPFIGINEYGENTDFEVYPNPTTDYILLKDFEEKSYQVEIYNSLGQRLISVNNKQQIDVSMLVNGTYLLILRNESYSMIGRRKFIKQ